MKSVTEIMAGVFSPHSQLAIPYILAVTFL